MEIDDDGWLTYETGDPIHIERTNGRHLGKRITVVQFIQHYAVTSNLNATVAAQRARTYWAPVSSDGYREGKRSTMRVVQSMPLDVQGSHALGQNHLGPGNEIANPGPLIRDKHGVLRTTYGARWDESDAIETGPVKGYPRTWTHWAKYADEELAIAASIGLAMRRKYPEFRRILGHHEADPKRKFDPGPTDDDVSAIDGQPVPVVFPMRWLRRMVFPELEVA